jgi:propanediol dehydratase small subunit
LLSFAPEAEAADNYEDALKGLGNRRDPALMEISMDLILTDEIKTNDVRRTPETDVVFTDTLIVLRANFDTLNRRHWKRSSMDLDAN